MLESIKDETLFFYTKPYEKAILECAAELKHVSLSSYILTSSLKQAQNDLTENEVFILSNHDRDLVMATLENPPEPNEALINLRKFTKE